MEFDKQSQAHACPGKEKEFEQRNGISGIGLFFALTIPFGLAAAAGWWVYRNWSKNFGQIRLGEQSSSEGLLGGGLDSDSPWVKYPVIALSATVAVIGAIPLLLTGLWRTSVGAAERWFGGGSGGRGAWSHLGGGAGPRPFTTRDSFARGRGDYAGVDDDEGELLGDDSDEEV